MNNEGPYHTHWPLYRPHWPGIVPLPWRMKDPPPNGITGEHGKPPTEEQLRAWSRSYYADKKVRQTGNLGLHLDDSVIGVDLDVYNNPNVRDELEALTGPLPPTLCSTARVDGSGIRLYSCPPLPAGYRFRTKPVAGCEIIQKRHRYVVVWPSIHPSLGEPYKWIDERTGEILDRVPLPSELTPLPAAAVAYLTEPIPAEITRDAVTFDLTDGQLHPLVRIALEEAIEAITGEPGGRHDAMTEATMRLARLAERDYPGTKVAVGALRQAFVDAIGDGDRDAGSEFDRAMAGAVGRVATVEATMPHHDDYEEGFEEWTLVAEAPKAAEPQLEPSKPENIGEVILAETKANIAKADAERDASWWPLALDDVLSDDYQPLRPDVLERPDGKGLFYPKRVNMLMGESGGGKSWVALIAVGIAIEQGQHVIYVDLEDHPRSITDRLRALGLSRREISDHFIYLRPEIAARPAQVQQVAALVAEYRPALLVIDSVGEAMALQGLKQNDDDAVAAWFNFMPREWAKGTCVLLIDHVPKSGDANPLYAIGSQRKRAAIDGAVYRVDQVKPLGVGLTGRVTLTTAKDRQGTHPHGRKAAEIEFSSSSDGLDMQATVTLPEERDEDGSVKRPTVLMERVSELIEGNPGLSATQIENTVSGKKTGIRKALAVLVSDGYVRAIAMPGRGGGFRYESDRPFRDGPELNSVPPVPTPSLEKGTGFEHPKTETPSPRPPSVRTEGTGTGFGGSKAAQISELRPSGRDGVGSGPSSPNAFATEPTPEWLAYYSDDIDDTF